MNILLDKDGRIKAASFDSALTPRGEEVLVGFVLPEDFDFERQGNYRIAGGVLIYDPLPEPDPVPSPLEALQAENRLLKAQAQSLDARSDFLEDVITEIILTVM